MPRHALHFPCRRRRCRFRLHCGGCGGDTCGGGGGGEEEGGEGERGQSRRETGTYTQLCSSQRLERAHTHEDKRPDPNQKPPKELSNPQRVNSATKPEEDQPQAPASVCDRSGGRGGPTPQGCRTAPPPAPPRPETASNASARAQLRSSPSGAPQPQGEGGERKGPPSEEPRPHEAKRKQKSNGQAYGQTRGGLTIPVRRRQGGEGSRTEPWTAKSALASGCGNNNKAQLLNVFVCPFVDFGACVHPASTGSLCLGWALPPPP